MDNFYLVIGLGIAVAIAIGFIINFLKVNEELEYRLEEALASSRKYCKESLDRYDELFTLRSSYLELETTHNNLKRDYESLQTKLQKPSTADKSIEVKASPKVIDATSVEESPKDAPKPVIVERPLSNKRHYKRKGK